MKRRRGEGEGSLTGGTGDVSPQWMTFSAVQSGADTTTTTAQAIPVQRLPQSGRAQVLEVLKVAFFSSTNLPASASATETTDSITTMISTKSFGTTNTTFSEPTVFAADSIQSRSAFTAAGTYFVILPTSPRIYDLTDGGGHGVIIATDNIYAQVQSSGTGATNTVHIKLLYRWKNVGLSEYIGIVQSQQ